MTKLLEIFLQSLFKNRIMLFLISSSQHAHYGESILYLFISLLAQRGLPELARIHMRFIFCFS